MYVSATTVCLLRGRSTPVIRAMLLKPPKYFRSQPSSHELRAILLDWFPLRARGSQLPLPLLMFRVLADHPHHTAAVNDLALVTDFLYRCSYLHNPSFQPSALSLQQILFVAIHDATAIQVVGRQFHRNLVPRQNADKVFAHLAGNM